MPEWIFEGGAEQFKIKIDTDKKTFISSKVTNFQYLPFVDKLFRNREERNQCHIMNLKIPRLTRDELHVYIISEILRSKFTQCYKYIGCWDDDGKYYPGNVQNKEKEIIQNGSRQLATSQ